MTNEDIVTNLNCAAQHKEMRMNKEFYDQKIFNDLDLPMQKLMELNVKMMHNLSYMKPMDLFSAKQPQEILQKNLEIFIQNSQMALNYMRDTFNILENHWTHVSSSIDNTLKDKMSEASSAMKKGTKKVSSSANKVAKQALTGAKKSKLAQLSSGEETTVGRKKASAKQNVNVATKKKATKTVQHMDSNKSKSGIIQPKKPLAHNVSKVRTVMPSEKNRPQGSTLNEAMGMKELGMHNPNKGSSF